VKTRIERRPTRRYRRRTLRVTVDYLTSGGPRSDPATTLGAGGLFIETETPLPPGSRLKLRFRLPGGSALHESECQVVWSRRPGDRGSCAPGMGIEFTDRSASRRLAHDLEQL